MIGANEKTISDKFWNTVFVTSGPWADAEISDYLLRAKQLGFEVKGDQILAARSDIYAALGV